MRLGGQIRAPITVEFFQPLLFVRHLVTPFFQLPPGIAYATKTWLFRKPLFEKQHLARQEGRLHTIRGRCEDPSLVSLAAVASYRIDHVLS